MLVIDSIEKVLSEDEDVKENISEGEMSVLRAYKNTQENYASKLIIVDDSIWEKDIQDMYDFLLKMRIDKVVVTSTSTGLMSMLHKLMSLGCKIENHTVIKEKPPNERYRKNGLILSIQ